MLDVFFGAVLDLFLRRLHHPVESERRKVLHSRQIRHRLQRRRQLGDREIVVAIPLVGLLRSSDGNRQQKFLVVQLVSFGAVRPAIRQDNILPLLQQRRRPLPASFFLPTLYLRAIRLNGGEPQ